MNTMLGRQQLPNEFRRMINRSASTNSLIAVLAAGVLLNYVDRANLATAAPLLQAEFSLSASQLGLLLSSFFWVYAPAQIVAGWLVHRYDLRAVMAGGLALWGLATASTGLAVGFASLLALRLVLGLGESVMFPTQQLVLAHRTTEHERGRANGIIGAGQGVGPMLGTLFGGLAMARFGWRGMFIGLGVVTIVWLWPWLAVSRGLAIGAHQDAPRLPVSYAAILRRRSFWGAALGHFSINYAFYFVITWLPTFLVTAGGFTVSQMAGIAAAIYGIYAAATVLAGAASDRWIHRGGSPTAVRKTFAVVSALGTAVSIATSAWVEPRSAVWLLGAAAIFFGLATPTMFAMTTTLAGPRAAGRWAGAQNVAGQVAGVIAPIITGFIVDRSGSFSGAFSVSAAAAMLALVSWGLVIQQVETTRWPDETGSMVQVASAN
jgi:MFS family permease